jgi:general stress protein 26
MEEKVLDKRIARAKQLLAEIHHVSIATVNDDGTPHNSPVFMAFDDKLNGFWVSHPETQHSHNIARDGRVFLVVFDSREGHGGLFIQAKAVALNSRAEAMHGHEMLKVLKQRFYGTMASTEAYLAPGGQRLYSAKPERFWVNQSSRDQNGVIIRDSRYEISLADLL